MMRLIINLKGLAGSTILKKLIIAVKIKQWFMNIFVMMDVLGLGVFVKLIVKVDSAHRKVFIPL